ncbi:hypothetical protein AVHY2522_22880 [Acidovorax sp. SUPP2522]|uniref:hypothetical protein n=1 Tax=unclassified Acidovorax TaxID=2684926 RepID=UPI00234B0ACE|nr:MULTISPECIES: hypothetical protein [unclassified Acidovorax]WCM95728.1 hypothetical protein M5C96_14695 [Acidovorax sp. GBBC 1281]GKT19549.1 hypothetical protein AVHY2522_22880 [Acidovorax sp. SUPP2522]
MKMFGVWTAVQVKNEENPRYGQAGVVFGTHPEHPTEVAVKFDLDFAIVLVPIADLRAL